MNIFEFIEIHLSFDHSTILQFHFVTEQLLMHLNAEFDENQMPRHG